MHAIACRGMVQGMAGKDKPEEPEKAKVIPPTKVAGTVHFSGKVTVRFSPVMDLEKVESARKSAEKITLKRLKQENKEAEYPLDCDDVDESDVPFITPGL